MNNGETNVAAGAGGIGNVGAATGNRFDYVQYDGKAIGDQDLFKDGFLKLETIVNKTLINPRAKALVLTKLEEAYMWVGKAIRDDQIVRNGGANLQEGRTNS